MSTWNFSYDLMYAPTKFNIRPTITINSVSTGLTINSGSNVIRGFSLSQIVTLTKGMMIEITEYPDFGTTRSIVSISIMEGTVVYSGDAITYGVTPPNTFIFYSDPGVFSYQNSPLSGQQIHDNFFYLSEGLMNHEERLSLTENYSQSAPSEEEGYIKYTGITRTVGSFYGGEELNLLPTSDFNLATVYDPSNLTAFSIAMGNGISYPVISSSTFYTINAGDDRPVSNTFTPTTFCDYINNRLINDDSDYGFAINSDENLSSYYIEPGIYVDNNWDDPLTNAGFYIKIDDADEEDVIKITFSQTDKTDILAGNLDTLIGKLNGKFGAISTKVVADKQIGADTRLLIKGINIRNSTTPGCTRIQILNIGDGTFIEDVLHMINLDTAYDFSTTIQFVPDGNKVKIIGLDPSFKIVLKDPLDIPLLSSIGFGVQEFSGNYAVIHTSFPDESSATLNFNGKLNAYSFNSESASFTNLNVTSLTLTNITVTGTNTYPSPINVSFEDLYVNNDLKVNNNSTLNSLTVSGASTFSSTVALSGTNTISGATTFSNYTYITNTLHVEDHTLYRAPLLSGGIVNPAHEPIDTLDSEYLLYNGSFGAYNIDAVGTLAIHGTSNDIGRLYVGSTSPSDATITLNFNGNFKATSVTGTSTREAKTDIYVSSINALDILMSTEIVDFKFKTDLDTQRIGFIAEDTHELLSTTLKNGVDITNSIGVIIKAIQELYTLIKK